MDLFSIHIPTKESLIHLKLIIQKVSLTLRILLLDDDDEEGEYEVSENGYHASYEDDMEGK